MLESDCARKSTSCMGAYINIIIIIILKIEGET